jgi:hypothetical protein
VRVLLIAGPQKLLKAAQAFDLLSRLKQSAFGYIVGD